MLKTKEKTLTKAGLFNENLSDATSSTTVRNFVHKSLNKSETESFTEQRYCSGERCWIHGITIKFRWCDCEYVHRWFDSCSKYRSGDTRKREQRSSRLPWWRWWGFSRIELLKFSTDVICKPSLPKKKPKICLLRWNYRKCEWKKFFVFFFIHCSIYLDRFKNFLIGLIPFVPTTNCIRWPVALSNCSLKLNLWPAWQMVDGSRSSRVSTKI